MNYFQAQHNSPLLNIFPFGGPIDRWLNRNGIRRYYQFTDLVFLAAAASIVILVVPFVASTLLLLRPGDTRSFANQFRPPQRPVERSEREVNQLVVVLETFVQLVLAFFDLVQSYLTLSTVIGIALVYYCMGGVMYIEVDEEVA